MEFFVKYWGWWQFWVHSIKRREEGGKETHWNTLSDIKKKSVRDNQVG